MKPVQGGKNGGYRTGIIQRGILQEACGECTYLHAAGADDVKGSNHARDKLDHLVEALVADTPGTINEEDQVCLGPFAHCSMDTTMFIQGTVYGLIALWFLDGKDNNIRQNCSTFSKNVLT